MLTDWKQREDVTREKRQIIFFTDALYYITRYYTKHIIHTHECSANLVAADTGRAASRWSCTAVLPAGEDDWWKLRFVVSLIAGMTTAGRLWLPPDTETTPHPLNKLHFPQQPRRANAPHRWDIYHTMCDISCTMVYKFTGLSNKPLCSLHLSE